MLSAKQCLEIGRQAVVDDYFYQAVEWMEAALTKIRTQNDQTATLAEAEIQFETAKKVASLPLILNSNN